MMIKLALTFLKIGFLGFGGGYAMLSLIYEEAIHLGLTIEQFADLNVLDVLIPGPIAINSGTYIGMLVAGVLGALVATMAVSVPSFIWAPTFIRFEEKIQKNKYLKEVLTTVKAASVGLIAGIGITLLLQNAFLIDNIRAIKHADIQWHLLAITIVGWYLHDKYKVNPILLTILAGVIGYGLYYII